MSQPPDVIVVEETAAVIEVERFPAPTVEIVTEGGPPGAQGPEGPTGPPGPPGGTIVTGFWDYNVATSPPPAAGEIRTAPDPPLVGAAITVWLSATDDQGHVWAGTIEPGDELRLRGSQGAVQYLLVESFTLIGSGPSAYATIVGTLSSSTGPIAKQARVEVSLIRAPKDQWLSLTQAAYDALDPPDPDTLYVIIG